MDKFVNFVYFNVIVYVVYTIIDFVFSFFNLYSNAELGNDLLVMPTSSDMRYIIINIVISTFLGYFLLRKIKEY